MTRYDNKTIETTSQGKPYIKGKMYPNIPLSVNDVYVVTTIGDVNTIQYYHSWLANNIYKKDKANAISPTCIVTGKQIGRVHV